MVEMVSTKAFFAKMVLETIENETGEEARMLREYATAIVEGHEVPA